jgi:hypothetical protein
MRMRHILRGLTAGALVAASVGCESLTFIERGCDGKSSAARIKGRSAPQVYANALDVAKKSGTVLAADGKEQIVANIGGEVVDIRVKAAGADAWLIVKRPGGQKSDTAEQVSRHVHDAISQRLGVKSMTQIDIERQQPQQNPPMTATEIHQQAELQRRFEDNMRRVDTRFKQAEIQRARDEMKRLNTELQ